MMQGGTLDLATVLGLGGALILVAVAIALGGSAASFVDLPSFVLVVGGTLAVTMISFSLTDLVRTQTTIARAVFRSVRDPADAAGAMLRLAERARKQGVLALQPVLREFRAEPFLYKALQMVVDGATSDEIERLLKRELAGISGRHLRTVAVLRKAAEVAPSMGLIGTLVGLVQMLGNLNDPGAIGPGMAIALLTTFYGALLANLVFAPLASKLERASEEEILLNNIYLLGAAAIGRQESPRRLELLLNTLLPPAKRVRLFD